jgi:hypothetical protein
MEPMVAQLVPEFEIKETEMESRAMVTREQTARIDRRQILRTGGALAGAAALLALPAAARAHEGEKTLTLDVACDGGSFRLVRQNQAEAGLPLLGDWFIFYGSIYPEGTIDSGLTGPSQAGSMGRWVCRGTVLADFATLEPMTVAVVTTVQYVLGDGLSAAAGNLGTAVDAISTEGFEAEAGIDVVRVITGGYGQYAGVHGIVKATAREENDTLIQLAPDVAVPAPNYTFVFEFSD